MKVTQKGFSVVEVLVIVVAVGLIGTAGWLVYDRQNSNKDEASSDIAQTLQSQPTTQPEQKTQIKSDNIADIILSFDQRLKSNSKNQTASPNAQYKVETLTGDADPVEIKENGEYVQKKSDEGHSKRYRLDRVTNDYDGYDEYVLNHARIANDLVDFAVAELGFSKVDSHELDGPSDNYTYQLLKKDGIYCQIENATAAFIDISCVQN